MEYKGKLYGKLGHKHYFDTGKTSDDYDALVNRVAELEKILASTTPEQLKVTDVVLRSEQCAHPRHKRYFIGENMLKCKICGKEFK